MLMTMESQSPTPVMDVSAPPNPPKPAHPALAVAPPEPKAEKTAEKKSEKPKATVEGKVKKANDGNSVTAAIVATVLIVFGLAMIATYAYLKQFS